MQKTGEKKFMTADEVRRRYSGEETRAALDTVDTNCRQLLEQVKSLQECAVNTTIAIDEECRSKREHLSILKREFSELSAALKLKEDHEVRELSVLYESQFGDDMDRLMNDHIAVPKSKLKKYWNQLGIRLEPASSGGVTTVMGFHPSMGLSDLRFVVQSVGDSFSVADCDPMVIGLSQLVDRLNHDTKSGSLARFCCRLRSTYTAQYSTQ